MKLATLITTTTLIAVASAGKIYCNTGTAGNNKCEESSLHTFCCKGDKGGEYVHEKDSTWIGTGPDGTSWCGAPVPGEGTKEGVIYCAK